MNYGYDAASNRTSMTDPQTLPKGSRAVSFGTQLENNSAPMHFLFLTSFPQSPITSKGRTQKRAPNCFCLFYIRPKNA